MAADEPFKRYEQAGAAFIDAAVNRLNGLFGGASDRADDATGSREDRREGRRAARGERKEHLIEVIRSEVRSQLLQLGLATREDIADVRSRLEALESRVRDLESRGAPRGGGAAQGPPGTGEPDAGGANS